MDLNASHDRIASDFGLTAAPIAGGVQSACKKALDGASSLGFGEIFAGP